MQPKAKVQGRLLWNDRRTVVLFAVSVAVTVAIVAFQLYMRRGEFDPTVLRIYYRLYLFQDYPGSMLLIGALVLAMVPAVQQAGLRLARMIGEWPGATALVVFTVLLVLARFGYLAHPLAMDESVPVMQSKAFAAGRLVGQFPPALVDWLVTPGFQGHFVKINPATGEHVSSYWPGYALLLTPFTLLGIPWACNPFLGALATFVIHRLTLRVTGSVTASGLSVLLTLGSAAFVINAVSFYSMTAHLLCNAVFALLLMDPTPRRALAAGMVGGLALTLHNPLPHMLFATPWLIWLLVRADRLRTLPAMLAGYLPWVIFVGFGWYALQGSLADPSSSATAAQAGWLDRVVALVRGVLRLPDGAVWNARLIDLTKLWIWAAAALVPLALVGLWKHRANRHVVLLAVSAAATIVGYLVVPVDQGHGWGHRYFHSAWFILPILAASVVAIVDVKNELPDDSAISSLGRFGAGGALAGMVLMVPFFLVQVHGFISDHLAQLPVAATGTPRVVIINPFGGYYSQDLAQNDPYLREPVIRMVTQGREADREMMARQFPDLELLESGYRGWVWGYPNSPTLSGDSGIRGVGSRDQREQE